MDQDAQNAKINQQLAAAQIGMSPWGSVKQPQRSSRGGGWDLGA